MRICLYARVSMALKQDPAYQFDPLINWLRLSGNTQVKDESHSKGIFVDEISSRDTRPKKEEVLKLMRLGVADGVAFVALDRWGRNMSELVLEMEEFSRNGKSMFSLKEGLDLSTAAGRMMGNVLAAMANFQRDRIQEMTLLGLARSNSKGKINGRHPINCGCGTVLEDGTKHDGDVKPIRNDQNRIIGWSNEKVESDRLKRRARERAKEKPLGVVCENCGISGVRLERHHPNYKNNMIFVTLCVSCHKKVEKQTPPVQPTPFYEENT